MRHPGAVGTSFMMIHFCESRNCRGRGCVGEKPTPAALATTLATIERLLWCGLLVCVA
jgi:hypothetical protein